MRTSSASASASSGGLMPRAVIASRTAAQLTRHLAVEELGHRVGLRKQRHSAAIYVERSNVQHPTGFGNCDPGLRPAYAYASRLRLRAQPRRSLGLTTSAS